MLNFFLFLNKFEILILKQILDKTKMNSRYMDAVDLANMKWHGSTTGNLRGGKIQEEIDKLHVQYNIPKNYERVFLSKNPTQDQKNLFYFLSNMALKMYEGGHKCEEDVVKSKNEEIERIEEEKERLQEQVEELEDKLEEIQKVINK